MPQRGWKLVAPIGLWIVSWLISIGLLVVSGLNLLPTARSPINGPRKAFYTTSFESLFTLRSLWFSLTRRRIVLFVCG